MTETFAIPCVGALIPRVVDSRPCLLLQERRKPDIGVEDGLLELPAGKLREYENVFDALRREVQEETGLNVTRIRGEGEGFGREVLGYDIRTVTPYCVTQNLSGGYSILLSTFICEVEGETAAPRWIPLPELGQRLKHQPEAFYPLHLGALHKYLEEHP